MRYGCTTISWNVYNFLVNSGSSHMTWKQKKDLENKKVVSLGGKVCSFMPLLLQHILSSQVPCMNFVFLVKQPPKKQRLPLSVARVSMKNQKDREEKLLQEVT